MQNPFRRPAAIKPKCMILMLWALQAVANDSNVIINSGRITLLSAFFNQTKEVTSDKVELRSEFRSKKFYNLCHPHIILFARHKMARMAGWWEIPRQGITHLLNTIPAELGGPVGLCAPPSAAIHSNFYKVLQRG